MCRCALLVLGRIPRSTLYCVNDGRPRSWYGAGTVGWASRTLAAGRRACFPDDRRASVPRYFFHRTDGAFDPDHEGTELPNLDAARREAIRFAAEAVRDKPDQLWSGTTFRIEVSDEEGTLLSTVIILEIESVAARTKTIRLG